MLRTPIVRVLFERGQFTAVDTAATAQALAGYAIGLAGFSVARITAQAFYAVGEAGLAVKLGLVSVAANVLAAVALMAPLAHTGLAVASSIAAYVNVALLLVAARRRFGGIGGRELVHSALRTLAACAPLVAWCGLLAWFWPGRATRSMETAWLVAAVAGGGALYWLAAMLLAAPERRALLGILPARRSG
jgi:putative peptidoglycan lipid II flippase